MISQYVFLTVTSHDVCKGPGVCGVCWTPLALVWPDSIEQLHHCQAIVCKFCHCYITSEDQSLTMQSQLAIVIILSYDLWWPDFHTNQGSARPIFLQPVIVILKENNKSVIWPLMINPNVSFLKINFWVTMVTTCNCYNIVTWRTSDDQMSIPTRALPGPFFATSLPY